MNCIVTAGPTFEPLDQVRRLTNFSTGQLGTELANFLADLGHSVFLLRGFYSTYSGPVRTLEIRSFGTTSDLHAQLHSLSAGRMDAVFHAAAVSDFGFGKVYARDASGELIELKSGKFGTRNGVLLAELVPTAKILSGLRDLFPQACLVGWKYEVEGTQAEALEAGLSQIRSCRTDACVVNGPAYGQGYGFVTDRAESMHLPGKTALFEKLIRTVERPERK